VKKRHSAARVWTMRLFAVTLAILATVGSTTGSAFADSPWIDSKDGRCTALWQARDNRFYLGDTNPNGGQPESYGCAVLYTFKSDHTPATWIWKPKDDGLDERWYAVKNPEGDKYVFFKVCSHRDRNVIEGSCTGWSIGYLT
jgi:hypothetical protein